SRSGQSMLTEKTMTMSPNTKMDALVDFIHGDRRFNRRYEISLSLRWRVLWRRKVLDSGVGTTINLSSGGILFQAERSLPVGKQVKLSITWPVRIAHFLPLQLVVSGVVVRSDGNRNAIHMTHHEFRTVAAARSSSATPTTAPKVFSMAIH